MIEPLRMDLRWPSIGEIFRYAKGVDRLAVEIDEHTNFHYLTLDPRRAADPRILLESGINRVAQVRTTDGKRRPVLAIRSSPWKAGHSSSPWHDEFALDQGHVRYFGDHKVTTKGALGTTLGNSALLETWAQHAATSLAERLAAPPLLVFRAVRGVNAAGQSRSKGYVEFCGVALIERLENIVQRDPSTGLSFPNYVVDLNILDLAETADRLDFRWIDDRRNPNLSDKEALRYAPKTWKRWVREGRVAMPRIRRRVVSTRVRSTSDQLPAPGSDDAAVLNLIYHHFDGNKIAFEALAAKVTARVIGGGQNMYSEGWLSKAGGDGGMDFVGRLDVGGVNLRTSLVVLGQAKCVLPSSSINAEQVARVVARLRRGWIGAFVTTGTFSRAAQIEIIDDQYPLVIVPGGLLAQEVRRMASEAYGDDVSSLLAAVAGDYESMVTHRRPEEIMLEA